MRIFGLVLLVVVGSASAQKVVAPLGSVVDVKARQAVLRGTKNERLLAAMKELKSCVGMPVVEAPVGRIVIPAHYLSGAHGPVNPAEAAATRVYGQFEARITAGMNQYLATGSEAEARCALEQIDTWAKAKTLLDYDAKESSQAWFQVGWTLCSTGIVESVLVNDKALDKAARRRVIAWLDEAGRKLISFEKPGAPGNNLHYWRALAATAIGVVAKDDVLFGFGVAVYKEAIGELDANGAWPREMERHERAIHYQAFALQPVVVIAELAARQKVDLYGYTPKGRTVKDAIVFFGRAVEDPSIVKQYTADEQLKDYGAGDYAPVEFYVARFGMGGMPGPVVEGLKGPTGASRIGGSTTVTAGR